MLVAVKDQNQNGYNDYEILIFDACSEGKCLRQVSEYVGECVADETAYYIFRIIKNGSVETLLNLYGDMYHKSRGIMISENLEYLYC